MTTNQLFERGGIRLRFHRIAMLILLSFLAGGITHAQSLLAGWEMNGLSGYGPSPRAAQNLSAGLTSASLNRSTGIDIGGTAAANAWGARGFNNTSQANAITGNDFVFITITPASGSTVSFSGIDPYNIRRSGTGPTTGIWQYRINTGTWIDIGSAITWGGTTSAGGNLKASINLSGIPALQNVSAPNTISFRVVNWNGAATGTWYFNNFGTAVGGLDLRIMGSITTVTTPTVTTTPVSLISQTSAQSGGIVSADGGSPVTARGNVWATTANPTLANSVFTSGSGTGAFTSTLAGLSPNTVYNTRAYATNSSGTSYGGQVTFLTLPATPSASGATLLTSASFQANWTAPLQGPAAFTYSLEVSEFSNFSSTVAVFNGLTGINQSVTGLSPTTDYYYRVRTNNATGFSPSYSNVIGPITTPAPAGPIVITSPALSITNNSATVFGSIDPNGTTANTFFDYGLTLAYGTSTAGVPPTLTGTGAQSISLGLGSLSPNTQYNYRARANAAANGINRTFTTLANVPAALSYGAPTSTTVTLNIGANGNPVNTEFAVSSPTFGGDYVQFNGTFGPVPYFQTASSWANFVVGGLSSATTYQFQAIAQNSEGVQTSAGPISSSTTTACTNPVVNLSNISNNSVTITITNPTGAFEYIVNTNPGAPVVAGTAETGATVNASGLIASTNYYAHVRSVCGANASAWVSTPFATSANPVGLVVYNFDPCPCASAAPFSVETNVTASGVSRGSGIISNAGGGIFNSAGFNIGGSFATAVTSNDHVTFNVQANPSYLITYTSLNFMHRRSSSGPANTRVGYSTDGGSTWTYMTPDPTILGVDVNTNVTWDFPDFTTGQPVIFRIWAWGASGGTGTYRVDDVVANGIVTSVCNAPLAQATDISITNIQNTTADISWTNTGAADARFVFIAPVGAGTPVLANGTEYFASPTFGTGSAIGAWYCIYAGTGNNVTVSNLSPGVNYRVFTSNANCNGIDIRYNASVASNNPNNFVTDNTPVPLLSSGPISNFGTLCAGLEGERTVVISGTNLNGAAVSISAPTNFAISLISGESYTSNLNIPYTGSSFSVPVYVQFIPTASVTYANNLSVSGGGASNITIPVNGIGIQTAPTVSTGSVSFISTTGATLAGSYTLGCAPAFSEYGIEYSVSPAFTPGNGAIVQSVFSGNNFSVPVSNLAINTIYYYRAYGINQSVTYYGTVGSFSTLSGALETIYNYGDNTFGNPFYVHPTLTGSNVVRSTSGWTVTSPCGSGFSGIGITAPQTSFNLATNPYVNVDINPNVVGNQLQVERISVQLRSSTNGANAAMLAYSIDGGTTWINRGVAELPNISTTCGQINASATAWVLPTPVTVGFPLAANMFKVRLYFYHTGGLTGGNVQILNFVVTGRILQSPDTYYSVSSGDMDAAIWSPTTTGTGSEVIFTQEINAVVQGGHTVTQNLSNVSLKNLTIQTGGALRANSTDFSNMRNISLFGNLIVNGSIGNGTTFDALGLNIEASSALLTGSGQINLGRIRKQSNFNTASSLTIQSAPVNVRFPGAAIYNNASDSYFNLVVPSGHVLNVTGSGGINGTISIDGPNDADAGDKAGSITVNGTLNVAGALSVATPNNNNPYNSSLTVGATGVINTIDADLRVNAVNSISLAAGSRVNVSGIVRHRQGTLVTNNALNLALGAVLLHGSNTPGLAPDPGGLISGSITARVAGSSQAGVYNYWSSPVLNSSLSPIVINGASSGSLQNTYQYDAGLATDVSIEGLRAGWQPMSASNTMSSGRGYITTTGGSVQFVGTPNNNDISVTAIQGAFTSFNLVGNPYPGPISAETFLTVNQGSNIVPALYFWDDDASLGTDYSTNDYIVTNATGTVGTGGNGAAALFNGRIATGQGFFVEARPLATQIVFNNTMRETGNAAFFNEPLDFDKLWLKVSSENGLSNETLIAFGEQASDAYDDRFDAKKLAGNDHVALYTTIGEQIMAIQAWSPITSSRTIPVGFDADMAGNYTFSIANLEGFDPTVLIFLEDLETESFHNLRTSDYSVVISETIEGANRFRLHFTAPVSIESAGAGCTGVEGELQFDAQNASFWNYTIQGVQSGFEQSGTLSDDLIISALPADMYITTLTASDNYTVQLINEVVAAQIADAIVTMEEAVYQGESNLFSVETESSATVFWNMGNGDVVESSSSFEYAYDEPGIYTVSTIVNSGTCSFEQINIITVLAQNQLTGIENPLAGFVRISPNPASEVLNLNFSTSAQCLIELSDLRGAHIATYEHVKGTMFQIPVNNLTNGVYLVRCAVGQQVFTQKFVVAH